MSFMASSLRTQFCRFYVADSSGASSKNNSKDIIPVVIYPDADLDKSRILAENLNTICVYRWVNKINGDIYVGSSTNLRIRLYTYYSLGSLSQSSRIIDRALLKYGYSNFSFEILEYCTKENVIEREQYYIDFFKPVYNIVEKAGSTLGYKHTDLSKAKMRNFQLSEEVRKVKLQSVAKAGEANRVKVVVVNIKTLEKKEYLSMTEAGEALGVHRNNIGNAMKNKRVIQKNFIVCATSEKEVIAEEIRLANLSQEEKKAGASSRVKVVVENINTLEKKEYLSMTEASKALGVHKTTIVKAIKNKSIVNKSFICHLYSIT
uniref:GIY-YIG domain-containing protein n=1 Tax=Chrysoporthe austroafricana TaxID=354353 RepID=A0A191MWT5_9PEZI|nr:hypothetical protein [Chrysoporthe austroafricana]AMX22130.1 hypothetical protein [Chrysoporthe austroafricana]